MNNNPLNIFQNMLSMGVNPKQIENFIFSQNPQLKILSNQMRQSGLAPIDFVVQYAKQNNVNVQQNDIYQMANQMRGMIPR